MEKSQKFGFHLPSRDSDDIADINQISDNFRIIDENIPSKDELKNEIEKEKVIVDQIYNSKSKHPQSGIAVAEAISSTKDDIYNNVSNSLKSTKSGAVITTDDVSPLEHSLKVKLTSDTVTDFSGVSVYRYGKNLIPFPYSTGNVTVNGVSFTDNGDGSITLNGTATAFATYDLTKALKLVAGQTYCLSENRKNILTLAYTQADGNLGYANSSINNGVFVWEAEYTLYSLYLNISPDSVFDNVTIYPMLELGSAPTEYEAYRSAINVTANADGTVNGLISVAPNMTLFSDNDEVIIHCEYNKDINSFKGGAAAEVDQVYDPESEKAQSGKALEPVFQEIKEEIGDIDSALDELHAYAQALVSGGATE